MGTWSTMVPKQSYQIWPFLARVWGTHKWTLKLKLGLILILEKRHLTFFIFSLDGVFVISLHFQNILAIYSWMFQHCKQQDNCSWCSMFIHFVYEERWWITPSNKSISRPQNQNFHPRLLCWELMNIFFPPGENWTNNIPFRQKRIFWLLRQRRNLHFILPHSFLKVTQEAKKVKYIYLGGTPKV